MRLICIGDSITYGYGMPRENVWTKLVKENTGIDVINCGINGDTTAGMLVRLHDILKEDLTDTIIMITGGVNDLFFAEEISIPKVNMAAMVKQAQEAGAAVLVGIPALIIPEICYKSWSRFVDYGKANESLKEYRVWLKRYADCFGVDYFDFSEAIPEGAEKLLIDGLHPNEEGHKRIAENLALKLKALS